MAPKQTLSIILSALMVSGAFFGCLGAATAEVQKPSVPVFTVKLVDNSYDVAPSPTTNPYTGETTTTPGYHVQKLSIEITIQNQPFTASVVNGNTTGLFYNIEAKIANAPHFASGTSDTYNQYGMAASTEENTVVTIYLGSGEGGTWYVSLGSQVDIRVQAVVGYSNFVWGAGLLPHGSEFTLLSAGDWSNTQAVTINPSSASPSPSVPEFPFIAILPLLAVIPLVVGVLVRKRRCLYE